MPTSSRIVPQVMSNPTIFVYAFVGDNAYIVPVGILIVFVYIFVGDDAHIVPHYPAGDTNTTT